MGDRPIEILYVDDETTLLEAVKEYLEIDSGLKVTTAISGKDALAKLSPRFDCIVSDYQMPIMDGIALLKAVRASGDTRPFIIFTGRGREEVVIQALNSGADFYLQKGGGVEAQFTELVSKIRHAVGSWRAREDLRVSTRLYATLSQVNQAIIHTSSEEVLLRKVCSIAVEYGNMSLALAIVLRDGVPIVAAANGKVPVDHLIGVPFVHPGSPTELCLATGKAVVADGDEGTRPGREERRRELGIEGLGLQSVAVLPLRRAGQVVGALNLSIDQPVFFRTEAEMALVTEMAGDISFALDFLAAEAVLREEWVMFKAVMDGMSEGVYIVNRQCDIVYVNPPVVSEFGTPGERKCYDYFHGRDSSCPWCKNEQVLAGQTVEWEWTSPKSGRLYRLRDQPLQRPDGTMLKIEFFHDITELDRLRKESACARGQSV